MGCKRVNRLLPILNSVDFGGGILDETELDALDDVALRQCLKAAHVSACEATACKPPLLRDVDEARQAPHGPCPFEWMKGERMAAPVSWR